MARPVFVIGTGRSGSCWLGRVLEGHPEVRCTVEVEPIFGLVTEMALNADLIPSLMPNLVGKYREQIGLTREPVYADKSHPNIWLVEHLRREFPDALFVAIVRCPYATVASMLKHPGIMRWPDEWRTFPRPNRFLGIESAEEDYERYTAVEKCALRWKSHMARLKELMATDLPLHVVVYEILVGSPVTTLESLQAFLGLSQPFARPKVEFGTTQRWRQTISLADKESIERITGVSPDGWPWSVLPRT